MTKELVISANRHETRVAVLEDDQLVEIYYQRASEYSLAGSIHKGRVTRVLPGMQSAFVDLGLERDTFLYVSDFFEETDEYEKLPPAPEDKQGKRRALEEPAQKAAIEAPKPAVVKTEAERPAEKTPRAEEERGERRSRRGRRRRGRGRGLPESKFAESRQLSPTPDAAAASTEAQSEVFPILPGESLAKYASLRREAQATESSSDELEGGASATVSEPEAAPQEEMQSQETSPPQAFPVEALNEEAPEERLKDEEEDDVDEEDYGLDEPEVSPAPRPAIEEASLASGEDMTDEPNGEEDGLTEELLDQIQEQAEALAQEQEQEQELDRRAEEAPEAAPAASLLESLEPGEGPQEHEGAPALSSGGVAEEAEEAEAETEEEEPAGSAPALASIESLGASHREQTARYLRSRRMRRRRGGSQSDGVRTVAAEPKEKEAAREPEKAGREAEKERGERARPPQPSISDLLKEGQEVVVQIAKEPMGQKGARITSHIALPGRYCVYMPTIDHLGVSRRIASEEERHRLRRILQTRRQGIPGGFIIRTAGEGKSEEQIAADIQYLYQLWLDIKSKAEKAKAPALLYHDVEIVQRLLRDQLTDQFKAIWVDDEQVYETVVRFVERMQPSLLPRVKMYTRSTPIFDAFGITAELEKALRPKVWLKSGGYIVINQTEALVAIDVNTGKFVGKSNRLEDTILRTNLEAVKEIVRQIRLRDLGGIIVVDFIDMDERKSRQKVMQALEEAMRADRAPNKILQFNDFGLVAITRKRVKQSLERTLCAPCPTCEGSGYTKSVQTVISEILVQAQQLAPAVESQQVVLRVHPNVAVTLKSRDNSYLEEIEEIFKRPVLVTGDATLHPEKFDIA